LRLPNNMTIILVIFRALYQIITLVVRRHRKLRTLILTDKQHEIVDKCFDTLYDCVYNDKSV